MATFSVTTAKFWDDAAFSTRAGNDTYNIDGGSLTIDTDTRYCANSDATKGVIGNATVSAALGGFGKIDATKVRLIPYDTGSGNVPAIGTSIAQGGVSGPLLGVWSALNVPPTAPGAAMPASGYLKIRAVTGGAFSAGAYEMANGRKIASADIKKARGSGMVWRSAAGTINRIFFGARSLGNIEATSQAYYQLTAGGPPVNYSYPGPVDEMIQVFGSTANGDAGAGNFDSRTYLANNIRTFGKNFDRKTLADSGITIMDGFSAGFALGESTHLTTGSYALADVYGGSAVAPFTGLSLEKLAVAQNETGFNEGAGNFTWVLNNTGSATLDQCVAYLDALPTTDNDIDTGVGTTNGKRVGTWYSYDAQGRIVTRSGADANGLLIKGLVGEDKQRVVQTTDDTTTRTYPFFPTVVVDVGNNARADANAWYHVYFSDGPGANDFNTANAITVQDKAGANVKGLVSGANITFEFPFDTDTLGGTPGVQKVCVVEVEGNGVATASKTIFTISRIATISVSCQPGLETNL